MLRAFADGLGRLERVGNLYGRIALPTGMLLLLAACAAAAAGCGEQRRRADPPASRPASTVGPPPSVLHPTRDMRLDISLRQSPHLAAVPRRLLVGPLPAGDVTLPYRGVRLRPPAGWAVTVLSADEQSAERLLVRANDGREADLHLQPRWRPPRIPRRIDVSAAL